MLTQTTATALVADLLVFVVLTNRDTTTIAASLLPTTVNAEGAPSTITANFLSLAVLALLTNVLLHARHC